MPLPKSLALAGHALPQEGGTLFPTRLHKLLSNM